MKRFAFPAPLRLLLALALLLGASAASAQDATARYWSDSWRGWHFYEDPPAAERERPTLPEQTVPLAPTSRAPELVEFERLQKTLEDTRNIAIMRPTEANVRRYMELESQVVARA